MIKQHVGICVDESSCCGCHACSNRCPKQCIEMKHNAEGFLYPTVHDEQCIACGACLKVCPALTKKTVPQKNTTAYAAYANDANLRKESSSGGVFSALAMHLLKQGGVVFGAALSEDGYSVSHRAVENVHQLRALRGSKYLQSTISTTYQQAKEYLEQGRPVLFTGTPCQIAGLYSFLQKEYSNLYTQDIICHGVPSPKMWERYLKEVEEAQQAKAEVISFRSKEKNWHQYGLSLRFSDGSRLFVERHENLYMRGFLGDLFLRPSCHQCKFKGLHRESDITLADFWGIQSVCPEMDDSMGTSLVLIHSEKGQKLFDAIAPSIRRAEVSAAAAIAHNPSAVRPTPCPELRPKAIRALFEQGFQPALLDQFAPRRRPPSLVRRILMKLKRILFKELFNKKSTS